MKYVLRFLGITIIATLMAGLYGILHDQFTYTLAPEYYTHFKFQQFALQDLGATDPRLAVSIVGFFATWWAGWIIGTVLAILVMIFDRPEHQWKKGMGALFRTLIIAFGTGLLGLAYGSLFLNETSISWNLPTGLTNPQAFINVGSMHNFSYIGALLGLLASGFWILRNKTR